MLASRRLFLSMMGLIGMVCSANAAIITNGNFESELPAGCVVCTSTPGWTLNSGATADTAFPNGGIYDIAIGSTAGGAPGTLQQSVSSNPGQAYQLTFYAFSESGLPQDSLKVSFGNSSRTLNGDDLSSYRLESFTVPGTDISSSTTTLLFSASASFSPFNVDDVTLNVVSVPEPASRSIMITAVLGLIGISVKSRLLKCLLAVSNAANSAFVPCRLPPWLRRLIWRGRISSIG